MIVLYSCIILNHLKLHFSDVVAEQSRHLLVGEEVVCPVQIIPDSLRRFIENLLIDCFVFKGIKS